MEYIHTYFFVILNIVVLNVGLFVWYGIWITNH